LKNVRAVAIGPGWRSIAIASQDRSIAIWDLTQGSPPKDLPVPQTGKLPPVTSLAYSPDSKLLVAGGEDGTVTVWTTSLVKARKSYAIRIWQKE